MYPSRLFAAIALAFAGFAHAAGEVPAKSSTRPLAKRAVLSAVAGDEFGRGVFQSLIGEFALRAGDVELAAGAWADLAERSREPQALARATEVLAVAKKYDQALAMVDLWLKVEPESVKAKQLQTSLLVLASRVDDLAPQIAAMLAQEQGAVGNNLLQLNRLMARHTDKKAVQRLVDRVAAPYGGLPEAHFAMAQAAAGAADNQRALAEIEKALVLRPDWEPAAMVRAQVLANSVQGNAAAIKSLNQFVARQPAALDARLSLARLLLSERRFDEARAHFAQLIKVRPDSPEVLYPLAMLALQQGDLVLGQDLLERLLKTDFSDKSSLYFFLGQISEESKQPDAALVHYGRVIAGEQLVPARTRSALLLERMGKPAEARALLHDTPGASPGERTQLLLAESQMLRAQGQTLPAYTLLEQALKAEPDNTDLLYEAALLADRLGQPAVLEKHLRHLLTLQPQHVHALNALGYSWADRSVNLQEAEKLVAQALSYTPEDAFIMDSMGWVYFRQQRLPEALATLTRAYSLRADPEIAAHLGEVLWTLGRKEEAQRLMQGAAKEFPEHEVLAPAIKKLFP